MLRAVLILLRAFLLRNKGLYFSILIYSIFFKSITQWAIALNNTSKFVLDIWWIMSCDLVLWLFFMVRENSSDREHVLFRWYSFSSWRRVTHTLIARFMAPYSPHELCYLGICASKLTIIGSDNGLSPGQAIVWTNDGILLIGHLGTSFIEILTGIHTFWFKKMLLKMSSGK